MHPSALRLLAPAGCAAVVGNLVGKTNAATGISWAYSYDDANELTQATQTDGQSHVLVQASYSGRTATRKFQLRKVEA